MAWRSLRLWFETFRKSYYPNVIIVYKNYLYDEWFNTLSEEEQKAEAKRQKMLKEKQEREAKEALSRLIAMNVQIKELANRYSRGYEYNTYSDIFNF